MAAKLHLEIISPDRVFLDEEVDTAVVRTVSGDMGLMNNHIPMVAPMGIGRIRIIQDGKERDAACANGIVKIRGDHAMVITDAVEWIEEIDIERARKARERAEERLNAQTNEVDMDRASIALQKALNRIEHYEQNRK